MPVQNEELGIIGVAVAALAFVTKGMLDVIKSRRSSHHHDRIDQLVVELQRGLKSLDDAAETMRSQTGLTARASDAYITQLARVAEHVEELLRMHRDPTSPFASVKTERLLETLLHDVAILTAKMRD